MELPSAIVTLGTIRPQDSGAVFYIAKVMSLTIWACLALNPLDMPRTPLTTFILNVRRMSSSFSSFLKYTTANKSHIIGYCHLETNTRGENNHDGLMLGRCRRR